MIRLLSFLLIAVTLSSCSKVNLRAPKVIYESKTKVDRIVVDKSDQKLYLFKNNVAIRKYDAHMGRDLGKKIYEGDNRTPEGEYFISNKNPSSKYFLSLLVSYPNAEDIARAKKLGRSPGGEIMIHGMPNQAGWLERFKNQFENWTAGCIAVNDRDMVEIYSMVDVNTPITIKK